MGNWCIIKSCKHYCADQKPLRGVKTFSIPAKKERRAAWANILNYDLNKMGVCINSGVCYRHFKPEHILKSDLNNSCRLHKDAVPVYFLDHDESNVLKTAFDPLADLPDSQIKVDPEVEEEKTAIEQNKIAEHKDVSTPFAGEFLRYIEKNKINKLNYRNKNVPVKPLNPEPKLRFKKKVANKDSNQMSDSSGSTLSDTEVVDDFDTILKYCITAQDNFIVKEVDESTGSVGDESSLVASSDFNLDLFDDVDPKEIEQYKTHFPNLEKIADLKSHCTSCNFHIGTAPINEAIIKMHPILRVTQCKKCFTFYNSGEFERGEDGSELYCRWCGQGGEVYCCSNCPYVFCRRCIVQNLSRNMVTDIQNNENWRCFACAPKIMIQLRANHWALVNFIEKQKREITNQSSDEKEINDLMSRDISKCCSAYKKRAILKRKSESLIEIAPPQKKTSTVTTTPQPKILNSSLTKKSDEVKTSQDDDDSVVVQCTPDILSLFNNEDQVASPAPTNNVSEAPPLRLIRREVTIRHSQSNAAGKSKTQSPPPIQQQVQPIAPPPTQAAQQIQIHTAPTTSNPVYHTINGFRIDLNTAAQQDTYRLPNGKLIQVKKQTPGVTAASPSTATPTPPTVTRPLSIMNRPQLSIRHPILPTRSQLVVRAPALIQPRPVEPVRPQYHIRHRHPVNVQTARFVNNINQLRSSGPIIQQINSGVQQMNHSQPPPLVIRTMHGNTPVGKARTQFEQRVDNSMEVCQHIIGKVNTLTNSTSFKHVKSLTDLKDLTIHLSYLLTYAIGRFKTLQEKCIEDMKNMGFDPDNVTVAGAGSDDDDIEIVEPKTTTINLDSDEEDEEALKMNTETCSQFIEESTVIGDLNNDDEETSRNHVENNKKQNDVMNKETTGELVEIIEHLIDDTEAGQEENTNNDEEFVQIVEINEEEKSGNESSESLEKKRHNEPDETIEDKSIESEEDSCEKEPMVNCQTNVGAANNDETLEEVVKEKEQETDTDLTKELEENIEKTTMVEPITAENETVDNNSEDATNEKEENVPKEASNNVESKTAIDNATVGETDSEVSAEEIKIIMVESIRERDTKNENDDEIMVDAKHAENEDDENMPQSPAKIISDDKSEGTIVNIDEIKSPKSPEKDMEQNSPEEAKDNTAERDTDRIDSNNVDVSKDQVDAESPLETCDKVQPIEITDQLTLEKTISESILETPNENVIEESTATVSKDQVDAQSPLQTSDEVQLVDMIDESKAEKLTSENISDTLDENLTEKSTSTVSKDQVDVQSPLQTCDEVQSVEMTEESTVEKNTSESISETLDENLTEKSTMTVSKDQVDAQSPLQTCDEVQSVEMTDESTVEKNTSESISETLDENLTEKSTETVSKDQVDAQSPLQTCDEVQSVEMTDESTVEKTTSESISETLDENLTEKSTETLDENISDPSDANTMESTADSHEKAKESTQDKAKNENKDLSISENCEEKSIAEISETLGIPENIINEVQATSSENIVLALEPQVDEPMDTDVPELLDNIDVSIGETIDKESSLLDDIIMKSLELDASV